MYRIVSDQELAANIYLMEVEAERIAKSCYPGQFVIVRTDAGAERIPLTICDYNREKGTIT
ncbi:MAG: NAD-binding oxidoreductase, partial [Lachnospiraceae bacterium]|nr:NAD-binding oxidoreductase [Lachnospiraceae bacterium]